MALPDLVLIHGGGHAADCWDLTIAELRSTAAELRVHAVDLPGRRGKPGDLRSVTIRDWADSVVSDIDQAGLDRVVIAGHSMAGLVMPGVMTKLGAARVAEAIFVVDRSDMPLGVPRTWVMTLDDRTLSEAQQRASIGALGGVDALYPIDTCHDVMISEPGRLAEILVERCESEASD